MHIFNTRPARKTLLLLVAACLAVCGCAVHAAGPVPGHRHSFTVSGKQFLMDGKPYQIIAGSMHYTRVPRA